MDYNAINYDFRRRRKMKIIEKSVRRFTVNYKSPIRNTSYKRYIEKVYGRHFLPKIFCSKFVSFLDLSVFLTGLILFGFNREVTQWKTAR